MPVRNNPLPKQGGRGWVFSFREGWGWVFIRRSVEGLPTLHRKPMHFNRLRNIVKNL